MIDIPTKQSEQTLCLQVDWLTPSELQVKQPDEQSHSHIHSKMTGVTEGAAPPTVPQPVPLASKTESTPAASSDSAQVSNPAIV